MALGLSVSTDLCITMTSGGNAGLSCNIATGDIRVLGHQVGMKPKPRPLTSAFLNRKALKRPLRERSKLPKLMASGMGASGGKTWKDWEREISVIRVQDLNSQRN